MARISNSIPPFLPLRMLYPPRWISTAFCSLPFPYPPTPFPCRYWYARRPKHSLSMVSEKKPSDPRACLYCLPLLPKTYNPPDASKLRTEDLPVRNHSRKNRHCSSKYSRACALSVEIYVVATHRTNISPLFDSSRIMVGVFNCCFFSSKCKFNIDS